MAMELQERNVFRPSELRVLKAALRRASQLIQDKYGFVGAKLQTVQLIAAAAIFEFAKTGDLKQDHLVEAATESVRVFLTWACAT